MMSRSELIRVATATLTATTAGRTLLGRPVLDDVIREALLEDLMIQVVDAIIREDETNTPIPFVVVDPPDPSCAETGHGFTITVSNVVHDEYGSRHIETCACGAERSVSFDLEGTHSASAWAHPEYVRSE